MEYMCIHEYVFTLLQDMKYRINRPLLFTMGFLMGLKGQLFPPKSQHHNQKQQTGQRETLITESWMIQLSLSTEGAD